jgi:hypothetical protein
MKRNELHLRRIRGTALARPEFRSIIGDATAATTVPLLGERVDHDTALWIDPKDQHVGLCMKFLRQPIIQPGGAPRDDGIEQCGADRACVESQFDGIGPV